MCRLDFVRVQSCFLCRKALFLLFKPVCLLLVLFTFDISYKVQENTEWRQVEAKGILSQLLIVG